MYNFSGLPKYKHTSKKSSRIHFLSFQSIDNFRNGENLAFTISFFHFHFYPIRFFVGRKYFAKVLFASEDHVGSGDEDDRQSERDKNGTQNVRRNAQSGIAVIVVWNEFINERFVNVSLDGARYYPLS